MRHRSRERSGRPTSTISIRGGVNAGSPLIRACPKCDAPIGHKCIRWRVDGGVRLYQIGEMIKVHKERKQP